MSLQEMLSAAVAVDLGGSSSDAPDIIDPEDDTAQHQAYLKSLPYPCETDEQILANLEFILGRVAICAETKDFMTLSTWDAVLECWLLLRYPMPKPLRAKLVRLYFELAILPGIAPRVVRGWIDIISRLLSPRSDGRRRLEIEDLRLPWRPLWRVLRREVQIKSRLHDASRPMAGLYINLAEYCRRYFSSDSAVQEMLDEFVPLLKQEMIPTTASILISFLPLDKANAYLPALFKIWEVTNSTILDDRMVELIGALSQEHVAADGSIEGDVVWKDVGMWTHAQWRTVANKALGSVNVPVGASKGASTTGHYADIRSDASVALVKKPVNRFGSLAQAFIYSMAEDGPPRSVASATDSPGAGASADLVAGCKALDSLARLIHSTESFFHPSNSGVWTIALTSLLASFATVFQQRWKEEQSPECKTPAHRRLTNGIKRAFVEILRTPALLAMFSKDPISMGLAQSALRGLAILEPKLVMPDLLERAYGGLESVNETHRTTAVLCQMTAIAPLLATEALYVGGQRHILPLLELCLPAIDLNDPTKTIYSSTFIAEIAARIQFRDISAVPFSASGAVDQPPTDVDDDLRLPDTSMPVLSVQEERALARESTAGFAEWLIAFIHRVLALYENLPEEGGKSNTIGGRSEDAVVKSLKAAVEQVSQQLSDELFDLWLRVLYDYACTNAKSNSVRAFGDLISCLARRDSVKTANKFIPLCVQNIKEELKHGASSSRSTSSAAAAPSDTTLHWYISILRGCLMTSGSHLLTHKAAILDVLSELHEKTFSERGYDATGRLLFRLMIALIGTHPVESYSANPDEWHGANFGNEQWGRLYKCEDVVVNWHTPSEDEVDMVLEILNKLVQPALDRVEDLISNAQTWTNVERNDFCRNLEFCRYAWAGLPALRKEGSKDTVWSGMNAEAEVEGLVVTPVLPNAGFALTEASDSRYKIAVSHRTKYCDVLHRAVGALNQSRAEGEDHIDAISLLAKSIETCLSAYGMLHTTFTALDKAYTRLRDSSRIWPKDQVQLRPQAIRRAHLHHACRLYLNGFYRRRGAVEDGLIKDLANLCLSPYVRVRKSAQGSLHRVCSIYIRSTRMVLPIMYSALARGTDPDRMKGALYVILNKGFATYAIADSKDPLFYGQHLLVILQCQHEEKPSVQQLVTSLAKDAPAYLDEEALRTDGYPDDIPGVRQVLQDLSAHFTPAYIDQAILSEAQIKSSVRVIQKEKRYKETIASIVDIATRPTTHWRYVSFALKFLRGLLRRDAPPSADVARLFMKHTTSPHASLRNSAQKGVVKLTALIKIRSYAKSNEELWLHEYSSPLSSAVRIQSDGEYHDIVHRNIDPAGQEASYIDKVMSGWLVWHPRGIKAYKSVAESEAPIEWEAASRPAVRVIEETVNIDYVTALMDIYGQESARASAKPDIRADHVNFTKSLAKTLQGNGLQQTLSAVETMLFDIDRFKQRAGFEFLAGVTRGSKHWPKQYRDALWSWAVGIYPKIYSQIKPDTIALFESCLSNQLQGRDTRRLPELISWIESLYTDDLQSESAFEMAKTMTVLGCYLDYAGHQDLNAVDKQFELYYANVNLTYAELRVTIAESLHTCILHRWRPGYSSTSAFLDACVTLEDPLRSRDVPYAARIVQLSDKLTAWRGERLPPPRVAQSEYDKVSLCLLRFLWIAFYSSNAPIYYSFALPLLSQFLRTGMTELGDNPELQTHSQAVLYIIAAVAPPRTSIVDDVLSIFIDACKTSESWRTRLHTLKPLMVFFYRNLLSVNEATQQRVMDLLLDCLADDNVEVRETAMKTLSSVVRVSQRQSIGPLLDRFKKTIRRTKLPARSNSGYADALRTLHSAVLGICALIESVPYSVEKWMPPLTDVLAAHATDPPPISTTIRKTASEFKKTHQDTWFHDQLAFTEDEQQNLSTMLVGTSYYA
ncbi:unnamed protein product [Peniophora sp. CBMAI 1063]|nr:unnamed protein product [Peniophora sp. CBMAI 1063]